MNKRKKKTFFRIYSVDFVFYTANIRPIVTKYDSESGFREIIALAIAFIKRTRTIKQMIMMLNAAFYNLYIY